MSCHGPCKPMDVAAFEQGCAEHQASKLAMNIALGDACNTGIPGGIDGRIDTLT